MNTRHDSPVAANVAGALELDPTDSNHVAGRAPRDQGRLRPDQCSRDRSGTVGALAAAHLGMKHRRVNRLVARSDWTAGPRQSGRRVEMTSVVIRQRGRLLSEPLIGSDASPALIPSRVSRRRQAQPSYARIRWRWLATGGQAATRDASRAAGRFGLRPRSVGVSGELVLTITARPSDLITEIAQPGWAGACVG